MSCKREIVETVKEQYGSISNVTLLTPPNMNEIWYTSYDGSTITPTTYNSNPFGTTLISNTYENDKGVMKFEDNVTYIGQNAPVFYTSNLKSIIIPSSVTSIGNNAFVGCSGLTSINIPDSVTSIGGGAFSGCIGLTTPIIHKNIVYCVNNNMLGNGTFNIPSSVTSIGDGAF